MLRDYLPRGNTLDDEVFRERHRFLCWVLALHLPALFAFGVWRGYGTSHSALEIATPVALLAFGCLARNRRVAAFFVTAGLVFCSSVLVHLSAGSIEAHFHFFILVGLIALYQDWVPFFWNAFFTVVSHGIGTVVDVNSVYNHAAGQNRPWLWAGIHGVSVLAACVGTIVFWRHTEIQQERNAKLAADLARVQADVEQRQSVSELFVNLARRNQSLLDRQLELIGDLEQRERDPEGLSDLFQLDHLATRIRRNAESLLVLSGDDPPRRWGRPVPLSEVVRAAAAEVEDFRRVEVLVNEHLEVAGRAVADLSHLLAELIENATTFSPPSSEVRVRSHLAPAQRATFVLSIEDTGIGMAPDEMAAANELLAEPPEVDLRRSSMLGFHVVARLAKRYGIEVRLAGTPGGGLTALVALPDDLVSERRARVPAGATAGRSLGDVPEPGDVDDLDDGWRSSVPDSFGRRPSQIVESPAPHVAAAVALGGHRVDGRADWPGAVAITRGGPADGATARAPHERLNGWHQPPGPVELPAPAITPEPAGGAWSPPAPPVASPAPPADPGTGTGGTDAAAGRAQPGPGSDGPQAEPPPAESPAGQPAPPERPQPGPGPGPGQAGPGGPPPGAAGTGSAGTPPTTASGLARRVPGAGLAPALRRRPGTAPSAAPAATPRDRQRVRSMLSRFQENQRAGREAARAGHDARHETRREGQ
ncbi:MAG TPA: ATP-binding protein [Acidimicrobiales bacterium]